MTVNDISTFDYIIAAILALFLLRGLCIGFVRQIAATAALVGSYWLAGAYTDQVMPYVQQFSSRPGVVFLVSFGGLFLFSALILSLLGQLLRKVLEVKVFGWADRITGGLLGIAKGALVTSLLYMILAAMLPSVHPFFQDSLTVPYLSQGADSIRQFIRNGSVRNDLKPSPPEKQEKQHGGKDQAPAETRKVEQATIPDQAEPVPSVPEQKEDSEQGEPERADQPQQL